MLGPSARPKVMYLKDVLFALFKKELRKIEKVCKYIFERFSCIKFMFSKKATKIDEIFNVDLTLCSKCQIEVEDFIDFCGLLRKHEL